MGPRLRGRKLGFMSGVRVLRLVAVSAVIGVGAPAVPATGHSTGAQIAGEIVFTRSVFDPAIGGERASLFRMKPDGSGLRLLMRDAGQAAVSPAGDQIGFVRAEAIWLMRRDGSAQRQLTEPSTLPPSSPTNELPIADEMPAWSSDGRTIYFSRWVKKAGTESIFAIRVDGTRLHQVTRAEPTPFGHCHLAPAPSPDGRIVAYQDAHECTHGIDWVIEAVTTSGSRASLPFRFPSMRSIQYDPAWAPDGKRLAYGVQDSSATAKQARTSRSGIYVSSTAASAPRRLVADAVTGNPCWSRDGNWIAYDSKNTYGSRNIWLVRADGTASTRLTRGHDEDTGPAWLPPAG